MKTSAFLILTASLAMPAAAQPAPAGDGGVAVVVTIPDETVELRAVARGVVDAVKDRWGVLRPPLLPEETSVCQADNLCLINLAKNRGASQLLIVGVADLGDGEAVLSLQLFEAFSGSEQMSFTEVVRPGTGGRDLGRRLTEPQLDEVEGVPSPDQVEAKWPPPPPPVVETYSGLSPVGIAGWTVTAGGVAVGVLGLGLGAFFFRGSDFGQPWLVGATTVGFGAITAALLVGGLGIVATDLFLQ